MSDKTSIEWTDATWNPVTGCTEVTPGCDRCYAKTFAERWRGTPGHYFENGFDVQLRPDKLDQPLRWKRPRRIFVNSMSDLFHDQVPDEYIAHVFAVMALAPQHTFQVLTKRHGRMRSLMCGGFLNMVNYSAARIYRHRGWPQSTQVIVEWPLPNVWLGVSAEDQKRADLRIPALLDTPAAVRFVSAEPLLGPIRLSAIPPRVGGAPKIDWLIVGGESGHGARPMNPYWARELRDECQDAGVAFLFKQWGEYRNYLPSDGDAPCVFVDRLSGGVCETQPQLELPLGRHWVAVRKVGKKAAGRELDGRTWDEYPSVVPA